MHHLKFIEPEDTFNKLNKISKREKNRKDIRTKIKKESSIRSLQRRLIGSPQIKLRAKKKGTIFDDLQERFGKK